MVEQLCDREPNKKFAIKIGAKFVVCDPKQISCVLASDHYSAIQLDGREHLSDEPLEVILKKLGDAQFMRVHRGALVNFAYIKELEREGDRKYLAVLSDPKQNKVPISREKIDEVKVRLNLKSR